MKYTKQIFMALFCILFTVNASAMGVTKEKAAKVARNYFSGVIISDGMDHPAVISESFDIQKDGNTVLYVFNFEKGGYVIVSAEDRFTPILGYSPDGYYDQDNMPGGFEFLMEEFSEMIAFIQDRNIVAQPEYTAKWERYTSDNPMDRDITAVVIEPMTALWHQDSPYNYYCPSVSGGSGGKAAAGCVATAMSMIMYYWRWPWQGTGSWEYQQTFLCGEAQIPVQSANFGETFYDYNGMFGTPQINAANYLYKPLALLQYHTGISVDMEYCTGSGTTGDKVAPAMINYFKYDQSIQHVKRQDYSNTAAWTDMLKEQMDLRQPVFIGGYDGDNGGHAFVCDGYDTDDMFHYNFGINGFANGYFVADMPWIFTSKVEAVINFIPDRSQGYPADCNGNWVLPYIKGMLADCSGPIDNYSAGVTATWLLDASLDGNEVEYYTIDFYTLDLASGDYVKFYDGENDSAPLLNEFTKDTPLEPVKSTGGKVLVKFTSSAGSATAQGFLFIYVGTPKKHCTNDARLTAVKGIFTDGSPEDMNYSDGADCKWLIYPEGATDETEIFFTFTRVDTEEGKDVITFYDHDNNIVKPITTVSGTPDELPQIPSIKTKGVQVTFKANAYTNGKGFEIEYYASPVSIREIENIHDLSVYPNPANDQLNIKFNTSAADDFSITIYNVTGQAVYKETLNHFMGSYYNKINIDDFAQGVYLMQVKSSKGAVTQKVVVQ